jgi:signal transduction histidine kinase
LTDSTLRPGMRAHIGSLGELVLTRSADAGEPSRGYGSPMVLALLLGLAAQLEVWVWWVPSEQGPRPLAAAASALMALALVWRKRAPMAVVAAVCAIYAVWTAIDPPAGSLLPFVIVLVAVFNAAQRVALRPAIAAGLMGLASIWLEFAFTDNDFANYAFTGVFVVGAWLAGRGFQTRERGAEESARAAAAEERSRIARELHDVVAHNVTVMVIQAQAVRPAAEPGSEVARALETIESTGQEALTEMRRLLGLLRADDEELALAPQPSLKHLDRLAESVRRAGLPVEVEVSGEPVALPPGVDLSAYRIVQEALTNALKHAGPARARVVVRYAGDELGLEITDDGSALGGGDGAGHGLAGMRERIRVYGGSVESGRRPGGGYVVSVRLPIEAVPR